MLISKEYFVGDLYIEGAAACNSVASATAALIGNQIESEIRRKEEDYLREFLGRIYIPFMEWLREYERTEEEEMMLSPFAILHESFTDRERSPIAYYVYFNYVRSHNSLSTANGTKRNKSNYSLPQEKLVYSWNTMVDLNRRIDGFIKSRKSDFCGYETNEYMITYINSFGI